MPVRAFNTRILVDQYDFSGDTKGITLALSKEAIDASVLQTSGAVLVPDLSTGVIDLNGYFGAIVGAGALEQELQARMESGADCIVSVLFDTTAVGNAGYVQPTTWGKQLSIDGNDKLVMVKAQWEDLTQRGLVAAHATVSAIGDQSVIDFGAAGAAGGWAVLHVRAIVGTAVNAAFTVKSSAVVGFTSPTTHGTFTLSAVGASRLTFAGAVGRYMRLGCTGLGGATSLAVTAIFGVSGVTG
jgi:hypothetical protein